MRQVRGIWLDRPEFVQYGHQRSDYTIDLCGFSLIREKLRYQPRGGVRVETGVIDEPVHSCGEIGSGLFT